MMRISSLRPSKVASLDILTGLDGTTLFIMSAREDEWHNSAKKVQRSGLSRTVYGRTQRSEGRARIELGRVDEESGLRGDKCWNLEWTENFGDGSYAGLDSWIRQLRWKNENRRPFRGDEWQPNNLPGSLNYNREANRETAKEVGRASKLLYFYRTEKVVREWLDFVPCSDDQENIKKQRLLRNFGLKEGDDRIDITKEDYSFEHYRPLP